ncbi:signal transduction histidine kinase [Xanthomonas sp. JAI131]|uniref:HAMP domain-containing sensor histidine kinase n=1 Tax=Xanthomonas sp. JAI131 TaxID=2723067 RepID=UPI0015C73D05|nr:ATP-binding protein [Xanthomonas sp. JAI131]NYF19397.1 signal transduction histidine kinase [Xanthomonas sp. JAI131]
MRALRTRLLVALAAVLLATWGGWFLMQYLEMTARQGGEVDGMLRNVAEQILYSLPADIATAGQQRQFALGGETTRASGKFAALGFQVWERGTGRRLMSSRPAPAHAMVPDFADGFSEATIAGAPWRVFALSDADARVQVQVGLPQAALRAELRRWFGTSLGSALLLLLCIGIAIWLVIHWSLRPVVQISQSLATRAPLDLTPLPEHGLPDEFMPLVRSFNQLMARLEQALQHERQFLDEAAHELRTPLAALLTQAQVLQHAGDRDEAREALDHLVAGIERTSRLAQQLLDAARVEGGGGSVRAADVDLALVAGMVADEFQLFALRAGQSIEVEGGHAPVHGDIDDLGILVRNLLDNALRHGGPGTRVRLETRVEDEERAPVAILTVADDGPGIAEGEHERVFERFYRAGTGHRAQGIGMGLSLVERVVASHGGRLRCGAGLDGRGFGVEIRLPALAARGSHADRGR